jgi:hypothetical protein
MLRLAALSLLGLCLIAGCGEGPFPVAPAPPPPPPFPVTVTVGPDDATIVVGGRLQYQALSTSTVTGWQWSLSDPTRGTISADGIFTASQPGALQVRACAANAPTICGAVAATVVGIPVSGGAPAVTVTPPTAVISAGQTVEFLVGAINFVTPGWTWVSLDDATASINASGLLTARRAGVTVVVACASSQPHYCGSAEVRVQ